MERSGRADDGGMTNKQADSRAVHQRPIHRRGPDGRRPLPRSQFINHDPPLPSSPDGPEGMRQAAVIFRNAFPDWRSDQQHMIAEVIL